VQTPTPFLPSGFNSLLAGAEVGGQMVFLEENSRGIREKSLFLRRLISAHTHKNCQISQRLGIGLNFEEF
jgi:hypothetical protein